MKIFPILCLVAAVKCTSPPLARVPRGWAECRGSTQCVPLSHCGRFCDLIKDGGLRNPGAVRMLKEKTCWVDSSNLPSVCCPEEETSVAERCLSCGRPQNIKDEVFVPLCTDCDDARPGDYPWMVRLLFRDQVTYNEADTTLCGGSLVSNTHVITAAHCLNSGRVLDSVMLGETDIREEIGDLENETCKDYDCLDGECGDDNGSRQCWLDRKCADKALEVKVRKWDIYPGFISNENGVPLNDIAIITLETPVNFTKFIQPLCLPNSDSLNTKEEIFTISGWGNTAAGFVRVRPAQVLQFLVVKIVDHQDCEETLNTSLAQNQMCYQSREDGSSACQGDSGGPLTNLDLDRRQLFGVISFGSQICGDLKPAVVARIDEDILRWIRGIVPEIIVM